MRMIKETANLEPAVLTATPICCLTEYVKWPVKQQPVAGIHLTVTALLDAL